MADEEILATLDLTFGVDLEATQDLSFQPVEMSALVGSDFSPGHEILPYRLLEKIGQGAYGTVWSALHIQSGRPFALKILRSGPRQGFQREAQRFLELAENPYVVPLVDANLDHSPPFLVTPLMQGSLGSYLRQVQGAEASDQALVRIWMRQVVRALEFVHAKGIVHCDLKPDNILLDEQGNCRVCDFGQAALIEAGGGQAGTFFFMAPEQAQALESRRQAQAQPSWDLYSLGATFYFLVTGQVARGSQDTRRRLLAEVHPRKRLTLYLQALEEEPLVACSQLRPDLDPNLSRLIDSLLRLRPEERPQSATEVRLTLSSNLTSPNARRPSLFLRAWSENLGNNLRDGWMVLCPTAALLWNWLGSGH